MSGQAPSDPPLARPPRRRGSSLALIFIGLLILIPSGLCTAVFGVGMIVDMTGTGEAAAYARGLIWVVLAIGGPPIALGTAVLVWGLKRDRASGKRRL
jgi:hypothetical protein